MLQEQQAITLPEKVGTHVCREEERSPVWGWDSDSSGGERGSLRPNAEELTDRARRNASHLLFGGAFQTTFEDATGEAQAETNCVNDRGPPDEAVKKQLAGRAEDISVWQDVGLLVGGQREALWTLHSHLAGKAAHDCVIQLVDGSYC